MEQLQQWEQQLEQREAEVAAAIEQLSQDAAVQAAWQEGSAAERGRITALIDHQRAALHRTGLGATVLETLRRMVMEVHP